MLMQCIVRELKHFNTAVSFLWHQWVFLCQLNVSVWFQHETDFETHFWILMMLFQTFNTLISLQMWVIFCVQLNLQAGYLFMTALPVLVCSEVATLLCFMCFVADMYYSSPTPLRTTTRMGLSQSRELLFPYLFMCTLLILAAVIIFIALCIFWRLTSRKNSPATASRCREPIVCSSSANFTKHQGRHVFNSL